MNGTGGLPGSGVVLDGTVGQGWWLVAGAEDGSGRVVAGPFADRGDAGWAAASPEHGEGVRLVYGARRSDGVLQRRPSPQDRSWLGHLGAQLERLPDGWDDGLADDDPLLSLVAEITAALSESGLPLHNAAGGGTELGGACLTPAPGLGGIVVTWRQHDRMSVDHVHGAAVTGAAQQVMDRALAHLLALRGFAVEAFGSTGGHVVRSPA